MHFYSYITEDGSNANSYQQADVEVLRPVPDSVQEALHETTPFVRVSERTAYIILRLLIRIVN